MVAQPRVAIPLYELASGAQVDQLHDVSIRILEEAGIAFYDPIALETLEAAGASVDEESVVRFDRSMIDELVANTPSTFTWGARDPAKSVEIGGDSVAFGPVAGPPYIQDTDGGRRLGTYADLVDLIKLTVATPHLNTQGTEIVAPNDIPFHERALDITYAHLAYGDKPIMGQYPIGLAAADSVSLARIVFGERMEQEHMLAAVINISSPRRLDNRMLGTMRAYAESNQALIITPFILAGAMGPASILGAVAQANAEALATIAYAQLIRPGTPCVYGPFLATVDLQSGAPVMGAAESALAQLLLGQLARRYELPLRAAGAYSSSKLPDMQAGVEAVMSMFPAMLSKPNFVLHAAGWLENGLTTSLEKFAFDVDLLGVMLRFIRGVSWDEDEWALESILDEVPPGGHHLGTAHTLGRFRTAFHRPELFDFSSWEQWHEAGDRSAAARANTGWKALMDRYEQPKLDDAVEEELQSFMRERRKTMQPSDYE